MHPTPSETLDPALSTDANDTASADTSGLSIISDSSQPEPLVHASVNSDNTPESGDEDNPPADGTSNGPPIAARTSQTAADYSHINPDTGSIWTFDELMLVLKASLPMLCLLYCACSSISSVQHAFFPDTGSTSCCACSILHAAKVSDV